MNRKGRQSVKRSTPAGGQHTSCQLVCPSGVGAAARIAVKSSPVEEKCDSFPVDSIWAWPLGYLAFSRDFLVSYPVFPSE